MRNRLNILIILPGLFCLFMYEVSAHFSQPDNTLFKISRSRDADEIAYEVALVADGRLDPDSPVNIYWIKRSKGSVREPLTWIQKRYSYGIKFLETSGDQAIFKFVSFDSKEFNLERSDDGQFRVYALLDNRQVIVERIFVQFDGGSFLSPEISEVILYGRDAGSGVLLTENIRPQ